MKSIYAKTFDRQAYSHYIAGQFLIFRELERLCIARCSEAPLRPVYDESLHRATGLERDLILWGGNVWEDLIASPSPATAQYLERLLADSSDCWLLLCHHFLQYNAVLSGGQFLGDKVASRAQEEGWSSAGASGAEFYQFPASCVPTHARVQRYIDDMDTLPISAELRARMLECMREVYGLILAMFDEAYAMAPVQGISYSASKARDGSTEEGGSTSKKTKNEPPPPPMAPGDLAFTFAELRRHNGSAEGLPLLTSVLGRVYDVSGARDLFGPKGPYGMFAGHDGTYNLAVMTLKKGTLDKFFFELEDEEQACLADWIAYFDNRYGRPLGSLKDKRHHVRLKDLPRATKIPFSDMDDDDDDDENQNAGGVQASATQPPPHSKL